MVGSVDAKGTLLGTGCEWGGIAGRATPSPRNTWGKGVAGDGVPASPPAPP